jgi:hypothetical protein
MTLVSVMAWFLSTLARDMVYLTAKLISLSDVPFESEQALRERGTSRTPDVLLSCPMGVRVKPKDAKDDGWRVVCWIDSKV